MRFSARTIFILLVFVFLASAVFGFSTQSISNNLSLSLNNPTGGSNHLTENYTITLQNLTENATCVIWGNWSSWTSKSTSNNQNLSNGTYNLSLSNLSGLVHNETYKWAVNCSSEINSSDYKFSINETFTYLNQTILDQDSYENDDNYFNANYILIDGTKQEHSFYPSGDEDWMAFNATVGESYRIETGDLSNGVDTYIELYDTDGSSLLESNDDIILGIYRRSLIDWTAPSTGTYYLKVNDLSDAVGNYTISLTAYPDIELSFVNFTTFMPQNSFFTVYVNVTCNGGNCTNIPIYLDPKKNTPSTKLFDKGILDDLENLDSGVLYDVLVTLKDTALETTTDDSFTISNDKTNLRYSESNNFNIKSSTHYNNNLNKKILDERKDAVFEIRNKVFNDLGIIDNNADADGNADGDGNADADGDAGSDGDTGSDVAGAGETSFEIMSSSDIIIKREYNLINAFSASMTKSALEDLKDNPLIERVDIEEIFTISNNDSIPLINADDVWLEQINGNNLTGSGQTICIVDTGIAYNHSDFGGDNFFPNQKVIAGYDFVNDDSDPYDDNWHGTHCAGTAAGENSSYKGVAPDANLIAMKACDHNGDCSGGNIIAGIDWCIYHADEYNISTISLSVGAGSSSTYCDSEPTAKAVNYAVEQGIFVAVAAGNDGWTDKVSIPSCASGATTVSVIGKDDSTIGFNRASLTDILAPGYSIISTQNSGGHGVSSGSSMATPHVAGAAALLNQYYYSLTGELRSGDDIKESIVVSGPSRYDSASGLNFSRLDVLSALNEPVNKGIISTVVGATPFYTTSSNPQTISLSQGNSVVLSWLVNATGDLATYEFYAFTTLDSIGEEELSDIQNFTIVDSISPVVVALGPSNQSTINISSQTLQFNISDNGSSSFSCQLYINNSLNDTNNFSIGANEFIINLEDDAYSWYVNCSDEYGFWDKTDIYEIITRDTSSPIVQSLSPSEVYYSANFLNNLTYNVYDESYQISNCSIFVDGVLNSTNNVVLESVNVSEELNFSEGNHSWNVLCYDSSPQNNLLNVSLRNIIVDRANPNTSIVLTGTLGNNNWYKSNVEMSFVVNETNLNETNYNYSSGWQTYSSSVTISQQGNISIKYYSLDLAGNNETVKTQNIAIDTVNPVVENFTTNPNYPAEDYQLTIVVDANDLISGIENLTVSINSGSWNEMDLQSGTTYEYNYTPSSVGNYTVQIKALDFAGLETTEDFWIFVGSGSRGNYDFLDNQTNEITNTTGRTEASIEVNTSVNGSFNISHFDEKPYSVDSYLEGAIRYASFETDQEIIDVLDWLYLRIEYLTSDIYGYIEANFELFWFNESSGSWIELDDSLSYVDDTDHEQSSKYLWANITLTGLFAIATDKIECVDEFDNEEIISYCFDENDELRSSGYMCDDEYQSDECSEDSYGGAGGGGLGGFSITANSSNLSDEPDVVIASGSGSGSGSSNSGSSVPAISEDDLLGKSFPDINSKNISSENVDIEQELTLGHKLGFIVLIVLLMGFIVYIYHFRDKTHRLSVTHKLNNYLNSSEGSEWVREDYSDDEEIIEKEIVENLEVENQDLNINSKNDLFEEQRNKLESNNK